MPLDLHGLSVDDYCETDEKNDLIACAAQLAGFVGQADAFEDVDRLWLDWEVSS